MHNYVQKCSKSCIVVKAHMGAGIFFIGLSVEGTFIVGTGTLSDVPNDFHIVIVIVCVGVPPHSTKWKRREQLFSTCTVSQSVTGVSHSLTMSC